MADDILILEEFLPYRLNRLADAVSRDFSKIYRERYGLTRPEWRTLAALGQYGMMTATAIGENSAMHKTKVSRAVAALEKRKWLTRKAGAADRRVEHLTLTRLGLAAYRDMVPLMRTHEAKFLNHASNADRQAIIRAIEVLESTIGAAGVNSMRRISDTSLSATSLNCIKIGEAIVINDIRLVCTCSISPEQYDAFFGEDLVGYLRLRHGNFTVVYPDVSGEIIYEANPTGDAAFELDEREHFLAEAVSALKLRLGAN